MATETKKFPLRILSPKVYPALVKMAKDRYQSVNSVINSILEGELKKEKK